MGTGWEELLEVLVERAWWVEGPETLFEKVCVLRLAETLLDRACVLELADLDAPTLAERLFEDPTLEARDLAATGG